jgi:hypothetical protein
MGEAAVAVLGLGVLFDGRGTTGLPLLETPKDVEAMLQQLDSANINLAVSGSRAMLLLKVLSFWMLENSPYALTIMI